MQMSKLEVTFLAVLQLAIVLVSAGCPFGFDKLSRKPAHEDLPAETRTVRTQSSEYVQAALALDWDSVVADIEALFKSNQSDIYPPDSMLDGRTSYAPFFIRQAWHCSGSYRLTDGLGGCSGGRQRFNPELSWPDNTNLDKAKRLMWPLKEKYGLGLSWGDLMILAGKVAIETGGGPEIGFCAGRPDQEDGSQSQLMGPNAAQQEYIPCPVEGDCPYPFGTDVIGLIYVNPGGFMGNYTRLAETAAHINITFSRMSMNAEETVALIGGGHAFGKTHGACKVPAADFPSPVENPQNPWPIHVCPNGTLTSGFEGYWTATPRNFTNEFFQRLVFMNFTGKQSPAGVWQYQSAQAEANKMMLPSDMSLLQTPTYKAYVNAFSNNQTYLAEVFGSAWYKLTTRDVGPFSRCLNISIRGKPQLWEPQPFQYPLPPPPSPLANFGDVKAAVRSILYSTSNPVPNFTPDYAEGQTYWGAVLSHLAFQCAATFRSTDHMGGCNGARIRLAPQNTWVFNNGMSQLISWLSSAVKAQFGSSLSYADLIVLAGTVAVEEAAGINLTFCGGRSDATQGYPTLVGKPAFNLSDISLDFDWNARVMGLTNHELVAISARLRSANQMHRMNYINGSWSKTANIISNEYFQTLLNEEWQPVQGPSGLEYVNAAGTKYMTPTDMRILWSPPLKNIAQEFASDNSVFLTHFATAWTKMMNADRFNGPVSNVCPDS